MKKILLAFFAVLAFTVCTVSAVNYSNVESVVFFDSSTNVPVNELIGSESVYAKVSVPATETGTSKFITASYDAYGKLLNILDVKPVDMVSGQKADYQTPKILTSGIETVKIFLWDGGNKTSPVSGKTGIINRIFTGGVNHTLKLLPVSSATREEPLMVANNKEIVLSALLSEADGILVNDKYVTVSAQALEQSTASVTYTKNASEWTESTVKFSGEGLLKLTVQDYDFCIPTDIYLNVVNPVDRYTTVFENTDTYLYRVGNLNSVKLTSLFKAENSEFPISNTQVTVSNVQGNAGGTFTENKTDWSAGTVKFTGTGVVEVTISDDFSNPSSLLLEIVNGTNATSYSEMKSSSTVMLNDIKMSENAKYRLSNATLYGNGFEFDVTEGTVTGYGTVASNYLVCLLNSNLDNVEIIGAVYTQYGTITSEDYNNPTVLASGDCTIANSYISNCASPVRTLDGNIKIVNSTLKGGNFANLDIRNGNITLENVTTINQSDSNDADTDGNMVVGLGIVIYYEGVPDTTKITVLGELKQYNELSKDRDREYIRNDKGQGIFDTMFTGNDLRYYIDGKQYINAGIVSMTEAVQNADITDVPGYEHEEDLKYSNQRGYMHAPMSSLGAAPVYQTAGQYIIEPKYSFDFTTKNYVAKTENSNRACYYSYDKVLITFDEGDSFDWDTSILNVEKSGVKFPYTVSMDGVDYTGKNITFSKSGDYIVEYTYIDSENYCMDENKNLETFEKTYKRYVNISVSAIKPDAKNAEFTFGSDCIASKTVAIGNETYVMPDVSATSNSIGSVTVSGTTVYCPVVDAYTSDGKYAHSSFSSWYMCFPVFKDVVSITDYQDNGTGEAVTYNSATTTLPSGLSVPNDPQKVFIYSSANDAPSEPKNVNGVLCYTSLTLSNNARNEMTITVKYEYKDNAGGVYYYYVKYKCKEVTVDDGCVTGDTMVTLSDGTKKPINEITYSDELMVWNFYKGEYEAVPSAIVFDHGYGYNTVIKLSFSDSTEVKVVNMHQFFNVEENKFVTITPQNVKDYLNKGFVKRNGDGYKTVSLVNYEISEEYIEAYGIISAKHYNILVEDMFSTDFMPEDYGLFNCFEVGSNMTFDEDKLKEDIEKYGLYSYDEFSEYLTPEQFEAFNIKYMKISVGKGYYTYEGILSIIERYLN